MTSRPLRRTVLAAAVGLAMTAAVVAVPTLRFAYRSEGGRLVLETVATSVAALVALLLYGRYRRSHALSDLLMVYGMALLALAAVGLVTLPGLLGVAAEKAATSWAAVVTRLAAAGLLLAAAVVPSGLRYRPSHPTRDAAGLVVLSLVIGGLVTVLATRLPDLVHVGPVAEDSGQPVFEGHPALLGMQVANLLAYAGAAVAFTRRALLEHDDVLGWFGAASALGAWGRACYLLFPSLYTGYVYAGDVLRLGFSVLLLVGAVAEIRAYWTAQSAVAVEAERRRLARDLHDGVVQELGFIRAQAAAGQGMDGAAASRVAGAADRALDEARRAVAALTGEIPIGLAAAVQEAAGEVADRYDLPVQLDLDPSATVPAWHREQLVRITREAVGNAARHASPSAVIVSLAARELRVRDDGSGFDPVRVRPGSFGLITMTERAEAIGGTLSIQSTPNRGTEVIVTW